MINKNIFTLQFIVVLSILVCNNNAQTYIVTQQFFTNLFSDNDIIGTTNPWTISGANIPTYRYFTTCAGTRLFGGFQILSGDSINPAWISKTWTNLPPHYSATISMKIYKIDSWSSDSLFVMIDGVSVQIYTWGTTTGTTDICGQTNPLINSYNPQYNQHIQSFTTTISHYSSTLSLKIISSLQSWTGSWGIRQLLITLNRCHLSCLTCLNPSNCATCDTANGLVLIGQFCQCSVIGTRKLIQTGCPITNCVSCIATTCPIGQYLYCQHSYNYNSTSCASCSPACSSCTGPSSLPPDCVTCNPLGYINPGTGTCAVCYGLCSSCTGLLQNQCTSCQYLGFLNTNRCLTTCPVGSYASQSAHTCILCNSPCATCDGGTANYCLSCVTGFYLYKTTCSNPCPFSMYGYNGACLASCPLGTYPDTTTATPLCIPCPINCQTCDQSGLCITCTVGAYFSPYDNLCHQPCPSNYYGDPITYVCALCDTSCLTCYGPTLSQCSSCPPLTYLVFNTCYTTCPPHTYSLTCQLCHDSCLNCTGASQYNCTSCNKLYMLHLNQSRCVSSCYQGDISDNMVMTCLTCPIGYTGYFKQCVACYQTCYSCNGLYYMDCTGCVSTAQHNPKLLYNINIQLSSNPIIYNNNISSCLYNNTNIIYMPHITNTKLQIYQTIILFICINIGITIILQILFKYKTNLLLTLQTMQLLSYLYYYSTPFSQSNQIILLMLYNAHPMAFIQIYGILPRLGTFVQIPVHGNVGSIFGKFRVMGKTGVFVQDGFYFHVFMVLILLVFVIVRIARNNCHLYNMLNPYLLTYTFRLLFMQLCLNAIIFFTYIQLSSTVMHWSLAILVIDIIILACSFFWKIRTQLQPDHAHYALFYFNQLGPPFSSNKNNLQYQQLTQQQQKQRKSILPSLVYYISRIPIIITIILFHKQPLTQSICILIYSIFLFTINLAIQYRRKIYKFMNLFVYFGFVICCVIIVIMCCGIDIAVWLDYWILGMFTGLLMCTFGQLVTNYGFFVSILDYVLARFCGRKRVTH